MKPDKTGWSRVIDATQYSARGLRYAWQNEAAFRQELIAAAILIPLAFVLSQTAFEVIVLIAPIFLLLIIELLNSAVEAVTDRIGSEKHELSGAAKDLGSAAVFVSMILCVVVWFLFLLEKLLS